MDLPAPLPEAPSVAKDGDRPAAVASQGDARARHLLAQLFESAVASADPARVLARCLPAQPAGRCIVVGAGKAAASMAAALESAWPDVDLSGTVVAPHGYGVPCRRIEVLEGGHPVPDENSVRAATRILSRVQGLHADDLVLALISGGGSAAMCLPAPGISLAEKRTTNRLLLASGLDIRTMNAVRRRISAIKGGKLAAAAAPARVCTLAISDIPGDDPTAIASGPTLAPASVECDMGAIVARLGEELPVSVRDRLLAPPEDLPVAAGDVRLIATPAGALEAAADKARAAGLRAVVLGDDIEGESREVARGMARLVAGVREPTVFLSGGETTVTLTGEKGGRGGRNTEFALALAIALEGHSSVWAIACDTDGEDGANLGAAGGIIAPDTLARARATGLDPSEFLTRHDSGNFFAALDDLVVCGPTRTNVNDFRAILVLPAGMD
ncbi:MAG: glycerate kinase [Sphingomonadales bacterium]|nr:glycerate kinase [Sphingomonadales bacterium]